VHGLASGESVLNSFFGKWFAKPIARRLAGQVTSIKATATKRWGNNRGKPGRQRSGKRQTRSGNSRSRMLLHTSWLAHRRVRARPDYFPEKSFSFSQLKKIFCCSGLASFISVME
jgi:hypothetical protein